MFEEEKEREKEREKGEKSLSGSLCFVPISFAPTSYYCACIFFLFLCRLVYFIPKENREKDV